MFTDASEKEEPEEYVGEYYQATRCHFAEDSNSNL
jgi:hypothetical protein